MSTIPEETSLPPSEGDHWECCLDFWAEVQNTGGKQASFHLRDGSQCKGILLASNALHTHLIVQDLQVPLGTIPRAILRSSDLSYMVLIGSDDVGVEKRRADGQLLPQETQHH
ncbi:MAG: hypothetical protein DHS80DRAFT_29956 [Piptocephalis tieghemiana]|nr:MAG: hypothetical protein DHS80DRAFT_29956 [Piptocephalis tieghemiana]